MQTPEEIEATRARDERYREGARIEWAEEGEIEISEDAAITHVDGYGAFVQAWVWVSDSVANEA